MATDIDLNMIDKRLLERLVKKGLVSDKDWERYVKTLPDLADRAASVETQFETGVAGSNED